MAAVQKREFVFPGLVTADLADGTQQVQARSEFFRADGTFNGSVGDGTPTSLAALGFSVPAGAILRVDVVVNALMGDWLTTDHILWGWTLSVTGKTDDTKQTVSIPIPNETDGTSADLWSWVTGPYAALASSVTVTLAFTASNGGEADSPTASLAGSLWFTLYGGGS